MKVGILGSGDVGKTLGKGFVSHGHSVKLGSRTPDSEKLNVWRKEAQGETSTGTFAEATSYGDILVFAPLGSAVDDVIGLAGAIDIGGITEAKWLEALVPLWVRAAVSLNSWNAMFKVIH